MNPHPMAKKHRHAQKNEWHIKYRVREMVRQWSTAMRDMAAAFDRVSDAIRHLPRIKHPL